MISVKDVLELHRRLVAATGGADGVRDRSILESALARPFQTFGGQALYPGILEQGAALIESLVVNHPFVDGNKRTGYTTLRTFLRVNKMDIVATEDEKYDFVISIAAGEFRYDEILEWLKNNTREL